MNDWRHIRAVDRADARCKDYIGDGVYVVFDGYGIWLTAEDGIRATDAVYLEPSILRRLVQFYEACSAREAG